MAEIDTQRLHHNHQRMKLLKAMLRHTGVGRWVDFDELLLVVESFGAPMVEKQLQFHLEICEQFGWVNLRRGPNVDRPDAILQAQLTIAGVDRVDSGRMPNLEDTQRFPRRG